jgi:hypothetical protein
MIEKTKARMDVIHTRAVQIYGRGDGRLLGFSLYTRRAHGLLLIRARLGNFPRKRLIALLLSIFWTRYEQFLFSTAARLDNPSEPMGMRRITFKDLSKRRPAPICKPNDLRIKTQGFP